MTDTRPILLTGISGFIAKRIARDLLAKGYYVRGSLRSLDRAEEVRKAVQDPGDGRLSFVALDLMSDTGWDTAVTGSAAILHTASPFPMASPKNEDDLIRPAVDGTLRALSAAQKAGVTRVIITSSIVAVAFADHPKGYALTAADWTDVTHPTASAYIKSKTLAEQAAWDFAKAHPEMQITTVNPGLVCGTPMDTHYGTSLDLIERVLGGKDPMLPDVPVPIVDVEDVSALHIAALEQPATIGQRILAVDSVLRMPALGQMLAEAYPARKIATKPAPRFLLKALSLFDPSLKTILPQVGMAMRVDTAATTEGLGHRFVPAKNAVTRSAAAILAKA
jgi:dihydroflavonol-4-reductase